jgi:hypothetical protein
MPRPRSITTRSRLLALVALLAIPGAAAVMPSTRNLLADPHMEKDADADGLPDAWTLQGVDAGTHCSVAMSALAQDMAHSVNVSAARDVGSNQNCFVLSQSVPVLAASTYSGSVWTRSGQGSTAGLLRVDFYDASGAYIPPLGNVVCQSPTASRTAWTQDVCSATSPPHAATARMNLSANFVTQLPGAYQLYDNATLMFVG